MIIQAIRKDVLYCFSLWQSVSFLRDGKGDSSSLDQLFDTADVNF